VGSAGSSKSYFITQKILIKAMKSKRKVLVARRYGTTIRHSVFSLFKEILDSFQMTKYCKIRESDFNITLPNGSEIIFMGLDDEQKLLSISNISDVFIEEVFECNKDIIEQLNLRLRSRVGYNQLFLAFNPISSKHWLFEFVQNKTRRKMLLTHSTYKDNPFLPASYVEALDEMAVSNPAKYKIYGLGEWGVDVEGLVYTNWRVQDFNALELANQGFKHRVGMDIGFIDPSAIVATLYNEINKTIYVYKDWYKAGCQLDEIADKLNDFNLGKTLIYCDSADARGIAFFKSKGYRVEGSKKGAGSVNMGIAFLQNHKIVIHPSCVDLITEIENYSYLKDKRTDTFTDRTTHEFSHSLDALRYAYSDLYTGKKLKVLDKNILGL